MSESGAFCGSLNPTKVSEKRENTLLLSLHEGVRFGVSLGSAWAKGGSLNQSCPELISKGGGTSRKQTRSRLNQLAQIPFLEALSFLQMGVKNPNTVPHSRKRTAPPCGWSCPAKAERGSGPPDVSAVSTPPSLAPASQLALPTGHHSCVLPHRWVALPLRGGGLPAK